MQKNELLKCGDNIIRILEVREDSVLIVGCTRKFMPKWVSQSEVADYVECTEEEMLTATGKNICEYDLLDKESRRFVHEHFRLIAGVLPFIGDEKKRCAMITSIAAEKAVSKQTIRNYLWLYLVYQDIAALAPKPKKQERKLTRDEKNMRWALNKYFYTRHKNSLSTAYTMMLKEKYCDSSGRLLPEYPSMHQFKYFYMKHRKMQTYYISREGLKKYQRNHRPLLGDGVQQFAPVIGTGMLDSTICDIYLVDDAGNLVGRPILTACVDAYSGLCCGYSLSWEGGVYSLKNLLVNMIADKVEWCKQFGISIQREEWDCNQLPATLVTDMGTEYKSSNIEQLAELGVTIINLPAYRPELKGVVEKFFDLIQGCYKKHLKGKGVIEPDFQERGVHDYRRDACLTMADFEKIVLHCILFYNNQRIIEDFPFTREMLAENINPHSSDIWNWGKSQSGANLITVRYDELMLTLFTRTTGKFNRNGLLVNKLRYKNEDFTEHYLHGGTATVAYNPDDVASVWLLNDGIFTEFTLAESRFFGFKLSDVDLLKDEQKTRERAVRFQNTQGKIDLADHIEAIASSAVRHGDTDIKQVRKTRKKEQRKTHKDFVMGSVKNG
ncbi:MAG: hypothetical protein E7335_07530 [Clostridiales bacterium]|nr:hypothetical protein [Clostridiales bacterium]